MEYLRRNSLPFVQEIALVVIGPWVPSIQYSIGSVVFEVSKKTKHFFPGICGEMSIGRCRISFQEASGNYQATRTPGYLRVVGITTHGNNMAFGASC